MLKGVSRIITGQIVKQNREGFSLYTPLATIGIRGTILTVIVEEQREEIQVGQLAIGHTVVITDNKGAETFINKPGFSVSLTPQEGVSPAFLTPQATKDDADNSLKKPNSQTSNDDEETDNTILATNINQDNENNGSLLTSSSSAQEDNKLNELITNRNEEIAKENIFNNSLQSGNFEGSLALGSDPSNDNWIFSFDVDLFDGKVTNGVMLDDTTTNGNLDPDNVFSNGSGDIKLDENGNAIFDIRNFENQGTVSNSAFMDGSINQEGVASGNWFATNTNQGTFSGTNVSGIYSGEIDFGVDGSGNIRFGIDLITGITDEAEFTFDNSRYIDGTGTVIRNSSGGADFDIRNFRIVNPDFETINDVGTVEGTASQNGTSSGTVTVTNMNLGMATTGNFTANKEPVLP